MEEEEHWRIYEVSKSCKILLVAVVCDGEVLCINFILQKISSPSIPPSKTILIFVQYHINTTTKKPYVRGNYETNNIYVNY